MIDIFLEVQRECLIGLHLGESRLSSSFKQQDLPGLILDEVGCWGEEHLVLGRGLRIATLHVSYPE